MPTTEQLEQHAAAAEQQEARARKGLDQTRQDLADEENDAQLGAGGAEERAAELAGTVAQREEVLRAASAELGRARAALEKRRREEEQEAERERQRRIPVLDEHVQRVAQELDRVMQRAGELAAELVNTSQELGLAIATPEAQRALGLSAVQARLRDCLARHFDYQPKTNPAYAERFGTQAAPIRLLDWPINHLAPEVRLTLAEKTRQTHDTVVRVFATKEAAEAAALRIGEAGRHHAMRTPAGLWFLIVGVLRGVAARRPAPADRRPAHAAGEGGLA